MLLLDCGCRDECHCAQAPFSENQLDGYAAAAEHILATTGQIPIVPLAVQRALWSRGGENRALAEKLHRLNGGTAA